MTYYESAKINHGDYKENNWINYWLLNTVMSIHLLYLSNPHQLSIYLLDKHID